VGHRIKELGWLTTITTAALLTGTVPAAHAEEPTSPTARDDDGERAARAALALRTAREARQQHAIDGDTARVREAVALLEDAQWEGSWGEDREPDPAIAAELEACKAILGDAAPAPTPAPTTARGPMVDVHPADLIRTTIDTDPRLRARWRRGSALMGVGIPVMVAGGVLFVSGAVFGLVNLIDNDFNGVGLGLFLGGVVALGGGGTMIGFGVRDRIVAKRDARRRLDLSLLPRRDGFALGLRMRF
jgi:hypothetical protein